MRIIILSFLILGVIINAWLFHWFGLNPEKIVYDSPIQTLQAKAKLGNLSAQYNLGLKYFQGDGITLNTEKAKYWWLKAATKNHIEAQYNLGVLYSYSQDIQDYQQAVQWWQKAAEQDNSDAQYNLGVMFDTGNGIKKDEKKTVFWWLKSAKQGNANAQLNLGIKFLEGKGVLQNPQKAKHWIKKAYKNQDKAVAKKAADIWKNFQLYQY